MNNPKITTSVVNYDFFSLESSMVYHLIYHNSLAIHVNHMFFLNTYLFGVFLIVASFGLWQLVFAVAALYALYAVVLTRGMAAPYAAIVISGLAAGAWFLVDTTTSFDNRYYAFIGLGVVLVSFVLQLIGHAVHEEFNAQPLLKHGFVSAPVLEYVSFVFRLGWCPATYTVVATTVDRVRAEAREATSAVTTE